MDYPPPRGIHKGDEDADNPYAAAAREQFMWEVRNYASAAYVVLTYWSKKSADEWPQHLKLLIAEAEAEIGPEVVRPPDRKSISVIDVVIYLVNRQYWSGRQRSTTFFGPAEGGN
ncbi:MAG: hypothetical protein ACLFUU_04855, partial [Desulfobacteraceae bacterium]